MKQSPPIVPLNLLAVVNGQNTTYSIANQPMEFTKRAAQSKLGRRVYRTT